MNPTNSRTAPLPPHDRNDSLLFVRVPAARAARTIVPTRAVTSVTEAQNGAQLPEFLVDRSKTGRRQRTAPPQMSDPAPIRGGAGSRQPQERARHGRPSLQRLRRRRRKRRLRLDIRRPSARNESLRDLNLTRFLGMDFPVRLHHDA